MNIIEQDWKVLVVLDACRYREFKEVYKEFYPDAKLSKAISPATYTVEWLNKTFPDYYEDIAYISANAYVNSGMKVEHRFRSWFYLIKNGFNASKHFPVIVDTWKKSNNDFVHPLEVNKDFHRTYLKHPEKRFILHYMQPHRPYHTAGGSRVKPKVSFIGDVFSVAMNWKIKKFLNMETGGNDEKIFRKEGFEGLKRIYKDEIRFALKYVKLLTDALDLKFIITSDHGERLGEHWWHTSHGPGPRHNEVVEVPWLKI